MEKILDGKVAVITGSGQGIGKGLALYFAKLGAKIVTNNRHPHKAKDAPNDLTALDPAARKRYLQMQGDAESTARLIEDAGGEATPCYADVSQEADAQRLVQTAIDRYGRIDILINNAAGLGQGTVVNTSEDQWQAMTQAKMTGAFNTMRAALPHMLKQGSGTILNSASNAWVVMANLAAYSAGNAGVVGLTKAAAKELLKTGVTVNAYCPQAMSPGHLLEFTKTIDQLVAKFGAAAKPDEQKMKAIQHSHADPQRLGPFLAYLTTKAGHQYSGDVFSVTAGGEIGYFNESQIVQAISKDDAPWTVAELAEAVPQRLLKDYVPLSERDNWNNDAGSHADLSHGVIFDRGTAIPGFAGDGKDYVNMFVGPHHPSKCSVGNVTMAPGTHSNWHRHFGYQLLLVTGGQGYYQEWGKPVRVLHPGDAVLVEPGVKHWHGATARHWFTLIGMILNADKPTEGLEDVDYPDNEKE